MVRTEIALAGCVVLLLANALLSRPLLWPLYVVAAMIMALSSLQRPSIDATVPRTVDRELLTAAAGLIGASGSSAMILGATIGGVLAAELGPSTVYALDVVSFAASTSCLMAISSTATVRASHTAPRQSGFAAIADGMRFVAGRQELIGSYLVDLAAMFLASATALLPFVASDLNARWALGLMYAAPAIGALIATSLGGWTSGVRRYGRAISVSGAVWGLAMVAFGFSRTVTAALLTLIIAGAADMYSGMFRMSLWNRTIPDQLRGRIAGIELLSYGLGPTGGQLRAGAVASVTNVRTAIWSGGVLCVVAIGAIYRLLPRFAGFSDAPDEPREQPSEPLTG
jgi:MFS family permease